MAHTPDTYRTAAEAVVVIQTAAANTEAPERAVIGGGWDHPVATQDDVCPDVFERGLRAYRDDERWVRHMIRATRRIALERVSALLGLDRRSAE